MATSSSGIRKGQDELRHEILWYKPGKAVPCEDERVVFPDKLVIGIVDLYGAGAYGIVHAMRRVLYGDVDQCTLAGSLQTSTEDQDEYLTDSISVIMINFCGLYEYDIQDLAEEIGCMLVLFHPSDTPFHTAWISKIKEITGRFPVCAIFSNERREAIEAAKVILKHHGITDICELALPDHICSDEQQWQCLELLRVCLKEGDRALEINKMKEICMDPSCRLFYEKTKKEAKEANQKKFKEIEERKQEKVSLQHQIKELQRKFEETLASHDRLVSDNAILKSEKIREIEKRKQVGITMNANFKQATNVAAMKMNRQRELELEAELKFKNRYIEVMAEDLQKTKNVVERLQTEKKDERARAKKQKRTMATEMTNKLESKQLNVDTLTKMLDEKERKKTTLRQKVKKLKKGIRKDEAKSEKSRRTVASAIRTELECHQKYVDALKETLEAKEQNETTLRQQVEELKKRREEDKTKGDKKKRSMATEMTKKLESKQQHVDTLTKMLEEKEQNETTLKQQFKELNEIRDEDKTRGEKEKHLMEVETTKKLESKQKHVDTLKESLQEKERNEKTLIQQIRELNERRDEDKTRGDKEKHSMEEETTKKLESNQKLVDSLKERLEEKERNETTLIQQVKEFMTGREVDRERGENEMRSLTAEMTKSKQECVNTFTDILVEKHKNETTLRQQVDELKKGRERDGAQFEKDKRPTELSLMKEPDELEREPCQLRTKIPLESEKRLAEQKKKAETARSISNHLASCGRQAVGGTSTSQGNSAGGFGMRDASHSGESLPDDEFADTLNKIADDLYDADKIESLGHHLVIIQGDIQRALMTNTKFTRVTSDGTRHMLKQWRIGVSREDERVKLEKAMRAAKLVNLADQYFTKGDMTSKNQEDLTDGSRSQHPDQSPESSTEIMEASEVSLEHVSSDGVPPVNDMTGVSTIRPEEQSSSHEMQDLPEDMSEIAPLVSSGMVGQNKRTAVDEIHRKRKQSKSSNN